MKNVRILTILMVLVCGISAQAQNVKLKKGNVLVDDTIWLKYDGCGGWDQTCSIMNLQGEEIIYLTQSTIEYSDEKYWKVKFLGTNQTIELKVGFDTLNGALLKKFYAAQVVNADGTLNEDKVMRMVEKYGNSFSPKAAQNNTQTIIIKEESRPSGVNINIGR